MASSLFNDPDARAARYFNEPPKADPLPGKVAAAMADMEAAKQPLSLNVPNAIDEEGFQAQLSNAVASLTQDQIHPSDIDPSTAEIVGAAFRQGNTVVSALSSSSFSEALFPTEGSEELSDDALLNKIKEDGYLSRVNLFTDVRTEAQYQAKIVDIAREDEDRKILASSGAFGVASSIAAGVIDLPTLLPVGAGARVVQSTVQAVARVGVGAGVAAGVSEAGLQATQQTRTLEESASNIGASIVLGSGLGLAIHRVVTPKTAAQVERRLDEKFIDMRAGSPKANAAGAQAVTAYRSLRDRGLLDTERVSALGIDTVIKNIGTPFDKIGLSVIDRGLRNPVLDLMDSPSPTARSFVQQFVATPWITKANAAGEANPPNVAGLVSQARGRLASWMREAENEWKKNKAAYPSREAFAERVYYAAIRGDVDEAGDEFVTHAAQRLRASVFEPIRKQLVEAGLLKDEAAVRGAQSYVPRVYNRTAVAAKKERFLEMAEEWAFSAIQAAAKNGDAKAPKTQAGQRKAAVRAAEDIFGSIMSTKPKDTDYAPTTSVRGYMKGRVFDVPDKALADEGFLLKNVFDLASRYTRTAGTDAAITQIFKKAEKAVDDAGKTTQIEVGDVKLSSVLAKVNTEFDELMARSSGEELIKLKTDRDRIIAGIENLRDIARGTFLPEHGGDLARTAELVAMLNYVRLLGGTVISSLTDPVNLTLANGFGRSLRLGIVPLLRDFNAAMRSSSEEFRRLSRLAGAVTELEFNSRMAQLGEFDDLYSTGDRALTFMRKVSNTFSKVSGIAYWNTALKQIAYNVTQARILENIGVGVDKLSVPERAWMASLGIGPDQAAQIADAYAHQVGRKIVAGIPYANHDIWPQEIGDIFRTALANESNNVVVTPQLGDRPIFASTPVGRLLFQFRGFMLANQARLLGRNAQLAVLDETGSRRIGFAAGLFGLVAMAALVDGLKRATSENEVSFDKFMKRWEEQPGESLYRALDRSSVLGVVLEASNIFGRAGGPSLQSGLEYAFGDVDKKQTRDSSLLSALGVPTINLIEDIGRVGFSDVPNLMTEGELTRSGFRRVRGLVPFNNVPVIQQVINEYQREVGTVFDWPEPSPR